MTTAFPEPAFDAGAPPRAAERLAAVCLAAAVVAGPVALGGTPIWARLGLEAAVAVAVSLWVASGSRALRLVVAPLAVAAIAGLQIVPLPPGLLGLISPLAAAAWNDATPMTWATVSLDPGASATGVRRLLLGAAAIAAVADLARRDSNRRLLMRAMAAAAVITWTLGLVFPVDPKTRILLGCFDLKGPIEFWKTEIEEPVATGGTGTYEWVTVGTVRHEMPAWSIGDGFGSYVISNHFAGALSLTVPIAIGLWLIGSRGRLPAAARYRAALVIVAAATLTVGWIADSRAGAASMLLAGLVLLALAAEEKPWRRIAAASALGYAAVVLACCLAFFGPWTGVREIVPEAAWVPGDNAVIVNWPVEPARLDGRDERRAAFRAQLGIPDDAPLLLFAGRLHPVKRPLETIRIFCEADPQNAHLVMVCVDGTLEKPDLERTIPTSHSRRIHLIGPLSDNELTDAYHGSDGFISLSFQENFGYAAAEALAHGLPVILSPGHDLAYEMPRDSSGTLACGWLLPDDSSAAAGQAINAWASLAAGSAHSRSHLAALGDTGRAWVSETLSFDRFHSVLNHLANTSPGRNRHA